MTKFDQDFSNDKEKRREKFKTKKVDPRRVSDDEEDKKHSISKQEIKKRKQSYLDEEWEDWDQYYNH